MSHSDAPDPDRVEPDPAGQGPDFAHPNEVLTRSTLRWSAEDALAVLRLFRNQRPRIRGILAKKLYEFWIQGPAYLGESLFSLDGEIDETEQRENDTAVLVQALAHGESLPPELVKPKPTAETQGNEARSKEEQEKAQQQEQERQLLNKRYEYMHRLQQQAAAEAELITQQMQMEWGVSAALDAAAPAGLGSPVMHAFPFEQGNAAVGLLLIGTPPPAIRRALGDLDDEILKTALLTGCSDAEITNVGCAYLDVTAAAQGAAVGGDATGALNKLIDRLKELENDTGMVEVHAAVDDARRLALDGAIRNLGGPQALLRLDKMTQRAACMSSFYEAGRAIQTHLSPELLESRAYRELKELYLSRVDMIVADLGARVESLQRHLEDVERDKREWDEAPEEQRRVKWPEDFRMTQQFVRKLGAFIKINPPEFVSPENFFEHNAPGLIEDLTTSVANLRAEKSAIENARAQYGQGLDRLVNSRLFDALIRNVDPGGSAVKTAFAHWAGAVRPMVLFEIAAGLRRRRIEPKEILTRHTAFWTPLVEFDGVVRFFVQPVTLFDSRYSVAVCKNGLITVADPTDRAQPAAAPGQTPPELLLSTEVQLRKSLREAPRESSERVLAKLWRGSNSRTGNLPAAIQEGLNTTAVLRAATLARTCITHDTFHTGRLGLREALETLPEQGEPLAKLRLLQAILECEADPSTRLALSEDGATQGFHQTLGQLASDGWAPAPEAVRDAFEKAQEASPEFVAKWVQALEHVDGKRVWGRLNSLVRGIGPDTPPDPASSAALDASRAAVLIEAARALQKQAEELPVHEERFKNVLAKAYRAVAGAVALSYDDGRTEEVERLRTHVLLRRDAAQLGGQGR